VKIDWVRDYCLSLPHVTEHVQWGDHLVFKIGGKCFAITGFDPKGHAMSLKASPEEFAELIERQGIVPAPYLARAHWVALETLDAIPRAELKELLKRGYDQVLAKLPKKTQAGLLTPKPAKKRATAQRQA
jgi:predicted DNA-binding protein (MmcQ/YjbR family)